MDRLSFATDEFVGRTIGEYTITQLLGQGKLNAVYMAQQQEPQRSVMLTTFLVPPDLSSSAQARFRARFKHEAEKLLRLNHPHLLPLYAYGEGAGSPYLVTPLLTTNSLARQLKQQGPYTAERALETLKQIATALDYAHLSGMVHGSLKAANILIDSEQSMHVANLGLVRMIAAQGIVERGGPDVHLLSVAGTFLGTPEYIAPEVVQGAEIDARADIYALGILLYEMLSGAPPFTGDDPFAVARQHVEQPMPPLQVAESTFPMALDLVIQHALERDPRQRYQAAGKLVEAFERALGVMEDVERLAVSQKDVSASGPLQNILPSQPTASRRGLLSGKVPRVVGDITLVPPSDDAANELQAWQLRPPIVTGSMNVLKETTDPQLVQEVVLPVAPENPENKEEKAPLEKKGLFSQLLKVDVSEQTTLNPFDLWSATATMGNVQSSSLTTPEAYTPILPNPTNQPSLLKKPDLGRRKTVALLATGGVAAVALLGLGGVSLAHLVGNQKQPLNAAGMPTGTRNAPQKTVIGKKSQALNSASTFTNPADKQESQLIHLPDGRFVAYETICPHQGVPLRYNPQQQRLICPKHGSTFDPARDGLLVRGPATTGLKKIALRINADGTISTL